MDINSEILEELLGVKIDSYSVNYGGKPNTLKVSVLSRGGSILINFKLKGKKFV